MRYKRIIILLLSLALLTAGCTKASETESAADPGTAATIATTARAGTDGTVTETEGSTIPDTTAAFGEDTVREIINSYYEGAEGYTWEDLYVILLLVGQTTTYTETQEPVFTLIQIPGSDNPILVTGLRDKAGGDGTFTVYTLADDRLYQLFQTRQQLYYDSNLGAFYLADEGAWYTYQPHNLVYTPEGDGIMPKTPLTMTSLIDLIVTSENINTYVH